MRAGERNCETVAGQCSHQWLKSLADQDKLSHSNKLCIPALIWPKYLTISTLSPLNVVVVVLTKRKYRKKKAICLQRQTLNACLCNYDTPFVFA